MAKETTELSVAEKDSTPSNLPTSSTNDSETLGADLSSEETTAKASMTETTENAANAPARLPASQPMTASTSSSSNPSVKDAAGSTVSPYGTRSRNRGGGQRPNYAEDREIEMDFDTQPSVKEEDARKSHRILEEQPSNGIVSAAQPPSTRQAVGNNSENNNNGMPNSAKDHIPGTLTFSANPSQNLSAQPSRKRKANGQPASSLPNTQVASQTAPGGQTVTRRASLANQSTWSYRDSNMFSFENSGGYLTDGKLAADDGTILSVNDHVYLVCEPPGEPYYLGRIMEFLHVGNDPKRPVDALRMNWYYRPKDIGRKVNDTRLVFASMHSDISPLTSLRGLCNIKHKSEVPNLDEYRKTPNCFWYEKLFDRYIHRYYEVIPTSQVVNVPTKVKRVLDDRWKFILVESGRGKELTSAVKSCKRCGGYCANHNSVDCAVCHHTYHMNCVRPPLLKKPSRGFAWACGPCSRAQERKLEARNTPNLAGGGDGEDEEMMDEEDDDAHFFGEGGDTNRTSPSRDDEDVEIHPGTAEQIHQASLWPFRYLGVHCKVEDALDYDDRIYPRASSRLGPRHQANVTVWHGRPVQLVKPAEIKRKYVKGGGHKKDTKLSKETMAALEAEKIAREKRPKWVIDEPPGYVARGEDHDNGDPDCTAELLYKPPDSSDASFNDQERLVDDYMTRAKGFTQAIGVQDFSVNFLDKALNLLFAANFDAELALKELSKVEKKDLKVPELSSAEIKKFEDGVAKYGSELHSVKKHVKSVSAANIVRFYYTWKKTERGKQVWGNYSGRKGKKEAKKAEASAAKLQDDVADDHDDSAFDNEKAFEKKRGFVCKFCGSRNSRQWRRAPNTPAGTTVPDDPLNKATGKDKPPQLMVALCLSCAIIWRKYAVQLEDFEDLNGKKATQGNGRTNKRKNDDTLRELQLHDLGWDGSNTGSANTPNGGTPAPQTAGALSGQENSRKKIKVALDKDLSDGSTLDTSATAAGASAPKKKASEKQSAVPAVPEVPKPKLLPCAVCLQMEPLGDQHLSCKECRMTVHRNCYGVVGENRNLVKWMCDMCSNDRNPQVSIQYKCMLCPHDYTPQDFVEPAKVSHKKKSEKEKEKDRIERENAVKAAEFYKKKQEEMNRPVNPREPLKRTANNNWVHVTCAVWTPEVKFGNAKALEPSEGIPSIPSARYDEVCKACKNTGGACVSCHACRAPVHVECAHQAGYVLGFDIAPVKGSRRDQFNIVNINGEAGTMTAAIWCKEHVPTKTIVHRMHDIVDETGLNALQLYVQNFKQADLALTGTVRKATLVNQSTKVNPIVSTAGNNRRVSTTTIVSNGGRGSITNLKLEDGVGDPHVMSGFNGPLKTCVTCGVHTTPKWWPYLPTDSSRAGTTQPGSQRADSVPNDGDRDMRNGIGSASPKQQVALAAAALSENDHKIAKEFQCHKCHWKKVVKKPKSPVQSTSRPFETPLPRPSMPQSSIRNQPLASPPQLHSHYGWPPVPAYSPSSYNEWSRPAPVSGPPVTTIHHFNDNRSPRTAIAGPHIVNQSLPRQSPVPPVIGQSPHTNGLLNQSTNNGYPPSPHRGLAGSHSLQNGTYGSYTATRPPPQHLTNGGPPPRAPENPFATNSHPFHPPFGINHRSPPPPRESLPGPRDVNHSNGSRSGEGRVSGGASASPSLHNLLS